MPSQKTSRPELWIAASLAGILAVTTGVRAFRTSDDNEQVNLLNSSNSVSTRLAEDEAELPLAENEFSVEKLPEFEEVVEHLSDSDTLEEDAMDAPTFATEQPVDDDEFVMTEPDPDELDESETVFMPEKQDEDEQSDSDVATKDQTAEDDEAAKPEPGTESGISENANALPGQTVIKNEFVAESALISSPAAPERKTGLSFPNLNTRQVPPTNVQTRFWPGHASEYVCLDDVVSTALMNSQQMQNHPTQFNGPQIQSCCSSCKRPKGLFYKIRDFFARRKASRAHSGCNDNCSCDAPVSLMSPHAYSSNHYYSNDMHRQHAVSVADAYWENFRNRAELAIQVQNALRANNVLQSLNGVSETEIRDHLVQRAQAVAAERKTKLTAAHLAAIESQKRLLDLVFQGQAPSMNVELIPTDVPADYVLDFDIDTATQSAVNTLRRVQQLSQGTNSSSPIIEQGLQQALGESALEARHRYRETQNFEMFVHQNRDAVRKAAQTLVSFRKMEMESNRPDKISALLQAQQDLADAQTSLVRSQTDYATSYVQLANSSGMLKLQDISPQQRLAPTQTEIPQQEYVAERLPTSYPLHSESQSSFDSQSTLQR